MGTGQRTPVGGKSTEGGPSQIIGPISQGAHLHVDSRASRAQKRHSDASRTKAGARPAGDDPASADDDESLLGGARGQSVARNHRAISTIASTLVSDLTLFEAVSMEPRFFRRFVVEQDIPHVKVHRRTIAKLADVLAAFDRLAGISPAPSAESEWSAEDTIALACGSRGGNELRNAARSCRARSGRTAHAGARGRAATGRRRPTARRRDRANRSASS